MVNKIMFSSGQHDHNIQMGFCFKCINAYNKWETAIHQNRSTQTKHQYAKRGHSLVHANELLLSTS